ncbi:hypothetical protein CsatA_019630 [Cannabis sativa]
MKLRTKTIDNNLIFKSCETPFVLKPTLEVILLVTNTAHYFLRSTKAIRPHN